MNEQVPNNKTEKPLAYYREKLAGLDPARRADELLIAYEDGSFALKFFNAECRVSWPDGEITSDDPDAVAAGSDAAKILLLRYLTEGIALPATGSYLPFRLLPWGQIYLTTFTGRCITRMAWKYQSGKEKFCAAAAALGGEPTGNGDAGFEFTITGDYRIRFSLWAGDEEFPPNAQIEYTDNFAAGFTAEDSVVAAEILISAISKKMKG